MLYYINLLFIGLRVLDIIDIILVALLIYEIYNLVKGTPAIKILFGIIAIFIAWRLVRFLNMELLTDILGAFISVGFIALIVVFQPEIRKFLLLLGTRSIIGKKGNRVLFWRIKQYKTNALDVDPIVQACLKMSQNLHGALIIISKNISIQEQFYNSEYIDSIISEQLIESVFYKNSPLHDGAMLIANNRIVAARCILPVSNTDTIPQELGLRHRSAVGATEKWDVVAIVVSEQLGQISWSKNGELKTNIQPSDLKILLDKEFNSI